MITLSSKTQSTILWMIAVALLCFVSSYVISHITIMQKKIDRANETIAFMKLEHEAAIVAANDANLDRKQIYETARENLCRAETALGNNSVFCDMPIPDDIRLLWEKSHDHASDKCPLQSTP